MEYHFSFQNPNTHLLTIKATFQAPESETQIYLPNWRPGRYQIQNFAKRIKNISAFDQEARRINIEKTSKSSWLIRNQPGLITIIYEYYAFEMDAGNTWLDDEQLYVNFVNCCIYTENSLNESCSVSFDIPENYEIACGLERLQQHEYTAPDYYRLVDSPLFASASLREITYAVAHYKFNLWIQGELPKSDEELINDFVRFTELQIDLMGGFPCSEYHFLFQVLPYKHYHGVEHWNSTVITIGPSNELDQRNLYKNLLGVSSHELFHTWNVIRLRPKEMTPYDFQNENYHKTGFITEGVTTYYGDLFLAQSGVFSTDEYLNELNILFQKHLIGGWENMSVTDSSYDLWLDGYEAGIPDRKVSIYTAGALAAWTLDWLIRLQWKNKRSLIDVMQLMWKRHGINQTGYTYEDYKLAAEEVFGDLQPKNLVISLAYENDTLSFEHYFDHQLKGTAKHIDVLQRLAPSFGLSIYEEYPERIEARLFGFKTTEGIVTQIAPNSPASLHLSLRDKVVSINNQPIEKINLVDQTSLSLEVNRFGRAIMIQLDIEEASEYYFPIEKIKLNNNPTSSEKENLFSWLGASAKNA